VNRLKGLGVRLAAILRPGAAERRMREEFAFHVEMETVRLREAGRSPAEARREALAAFGGVDRYEEEMRDGRGARWFHDAIADFRYALRMFRRSPGLALAVALTLGIGIGINGFTYGVVDGMLVRPIPARAPEQLIGVFPRNTKTGRSDSLAYLDFVDYRDSSGAFADLAGMYGTPVNLLVNESSPVTTWAEMVTENYFSVLEMTPAAGRFFGPADARPGANAFAVLSYTTWQSRFGGDPAVVGRVLRINGAPFTITGVAPSGFRGMRTFGFWPEVWVPAGMYQAILPGRTGVLDGRGRGWLTTFARMHDGWDLSRTRSAANAFANYLGQEFPEANKDRDIVLVGARSGFENPFFVKPQVLTISSALGIGAGAITLLIICANLANLLMARAAARRRELAIRLSLGCSRRRLIRQLLAETFVLALPGAMLAAAIVRATPWIEPLMLPAFPFRVGLDLGPNVRVALFTTIAGLAAVLLIGLLPAVRAGRTDLVPSLATFGQGPGRGRKRVTLRNALVVSQLALSMVLLAAGTLFMRSLMNAQASDMGFDARDRLLVSVNLGLQRYSETSGRRFYEEVQSKVSARTDVAAAAWSFPVPFDTQDRSLPLYTGGSVNTRDGTYRTDVSVVGDDFVAALGLRLVTGRSFEARDVAGAPAIMVISQSLASRLWPGEAAAGRTVRLGSVSGTPITIVGVVADATFRALGDPSTERVYLPLRQHYRDWQTLVVHTLGNPRLVLPYVRDIIADVDPTLPVFGATTMEDAVDSSQSPSRIAAAAGALFGAFALLIAAVGLYAVTASSVAARTREMGVRLALGSTPRALTRLVMSDGARLGFWGLAAGLAGAIGLARAMASLLFGVPALDPITLAIVPLTLLTVVLVATDLPARRAARLDPMGVLRNE
jgi:predicted permease